MGAILRECFGFEFVSHASYRRRNSKWSDTILTTGISVNKVGPYLAPRGQSFTDRNWSLYSGKSHYRSMSNQHSSGSERWKAIEVTVIN